jgi:hypothetical protein
MTVPYLFSPKPATAAGRVSHFGEKPFLSGSAMPDLPGSTFVFRTSIHPQYKLLSIV